MELIKHAQPGAEQDNKPVRDTVAAIIAEVRQGGEQAVLRLEKKLSGIKRGTVRVNPDTIKAAADTLDAETADALRFAAERIREFALKQKECLLPLHYQSGIPGLELGHSLCPVESCGCYVPAGRHPLPSSALMSVITAKVAGVPRIAACSPPVAEYGGIHPVVLAALDIAGADEIYCMGGAQAIAAFAYGISGIKPVDFIAGPGNRYVAEAKRQILGDAGIDSIAGPSEVLIVADNSANAEFIAADLLAQCEHDSAARATLVSLSRPLADSVTTAVDAGLRRLEEAHNNEQALTARIAWRDNGEIYLAQNLDEAAAFANSRAPEHLEVQIAPEFELSFIGKLTAYGSLFVGSYAPVALGDFVSGPNHILPTGRTARFSSGLWVGSFMRIQFRQFVSREACAALARPCARLAHDEGLFAHEQSVLIRQKF
jgi:histidinol dehydrogenase/sulfopropanediol 3-dehydrogenase